MGVGVFRLHKTAERASIGLRKVDQVGDVPASCGLPVRKLRLNQRKVLAGWGLINEGNWLLGGNSMILWTAPPY